MIYNDVCFLIYKVEVDAGVIKEWCEARVFSGLGTSEVLDRSEVVERPDGSDKSKVIRVLHESRERLEMKLVAQGWRQTPNFLFFMKGYRLPIEDNHISNMVRELNNLLEQNEINFSEAIDMRDALLNYEMLRFGLITEENLKMK